MGNPFSSIIQWLKGNNEPDIETPRNSSNSSSKTSSKNNDTENDYYIDILDDSPFSEPLNNINPRYNTFVPDEVIETPSNTANFSHPLILAGDHNKDDLTDSCCIDMSWLYSNTYATSQFLDPPDAAKVLVPELSLWKDAKIIFALAPAAIAANLQADLGGKFAKSLAETLLGSYLSKTSISNFGNFSGFVNLYANVLVLTRTLTMAGETLKERFADPINYFDNKFAKATYLTENLRVIKEITEKFKENFLHVLLTAVTTSWAFFTLFPNYGIVLQTIIGDTSKLFINQFFSGLSTFALAFRGINNFFNFIIDSILPFISAERQEQRDSASEIRKQIIQALNEALPPEEKLTPLQIKLLSQGTTSEMEFATSPGAKSLFKLLPLTIATVFASIFFSGIISVYSYSIFTVGLKYSASLFSLEFATVGSALGALARFLLLDFATLKVIFGIWDSLLSNPILTIAGREASSSYLSYLHPYFEKGLDLLTAAMMISFSTLSAPQLNLNALADVISNNSLSHWFINFFGGNNQQKNILRAWGIGSGAAAAINTQDSCIAQKEFLNRLIDHLLNKMGNQELRNRVHRGTTPEEKCKKLMKYFATGLSDQSLLNEFSKRDTSQSNNRFTFWCIPRTTHPYTLNEEGNKVINEINVDPALRPAFSS